MNCRVCDATEFSIAIDLGKQPLALQFLKAEHVGEEPYYPLQVVYCHQCQTAQLNYTVPKEVMYKDHTYLSGITRTLADHFRAIAVDVNNRFFTHQTKKSVLDIGSNDGTQLIEYQKLGFEVLGVEAAETPARIAIQNHVPTEHAFFNLETADRIGQTFDVVNASGVFFHLEELHSVTEAIQKYLKREGIFVVQFLYMKSILDNLAFDQIYHEHLLYYTLKTVNRLLNRHGLTLFDASFSPIHGGSIIGYVGHQGVRSPTSRLLALRADEDHSQCNELATYQKFAEKLTKLKQENLHFFEQRKGKKIFGMGAPVKGNTLLNYFGIGPRHLECLVEKNELRRGLFSPGQHIPILIEKEVIPPDVYYVLAWNFKKEILQNNRHLIERGTEFYFPIQPAIT